MAVLRFAGDRVASLRHVARPLLFAVAWVVTNMRPVHAQDARFVEFDPAFLPAGAATVDLARFSRGNPVLPGDYDVDVWLNDEWQSHGTVRFAAPSAGAEATPCIADAQLTDYGVDPSALQVAAADPCVALGTRIPSASVRFDIGQQRLDIEVPQAALARRQRGAAPVAQWDPGITAGLLAWRAGARRTATPWRSTSSSFLAVDAGFNHGSWRLRQAGSWAAGRYSRGQAYAERQLSSMASQMRVGDIAPADDLFPPVAVRGASLSSDPRMSNDGAGWHAPRVSGVAATHATVRVTQNGVLLHEMAVPPGPFLIDELHAAARAGDLDVDIEERDGHHRRFRIPYFPVPELVSEGRNLFSVVAGRPVATRGRVSRLAQATWRHGLPHGVTSSLGWRQAGARTSLLAGAAVDTLAGAFATEATRSAGDGSRGASWRLRHGRRWSERSVASLSLSWERGTGTAERGAVGRGIARRYDALLQHELGNGGGSLSIALGRRVYGHAESAVEQNVAWMRSWGRAAIDVSFRRSRVRDTLGVHRDVSGQIGFSMPLGVASAPLVHVAAQAARQGGALRVGLHGSSGRDDATLYSLAATTRRDSGATLDASVSRRLGGGEVSVSVERSRLANSTALAASGGMILHAGGVTFAQRLGESIGLVHAAGARGARLGGYSDVTVDRRGYAVVPYLTPFRWNAVDLDPTGTSLDLGIEATHRRVAPTAGAVVSLPFATQVARTRLIVVRRPDGSPLPFGAEIVDQAGRSVGVAGQGGQVFLRSNDPDDRWTARWPGDPDGRCDVRIVGSHPIASGDTQHTGVCE
ncbi:fimbria/pilus outer membrane usher protein [Luteibacter sp. 329MFSha]|uniref:fimbria/pilus outer membrane usher protein n=1 Tax=Luteibacter sp. 329MFSha TaxID=1798239 RepID=UPI0008D59E76|nr:fimbria/pilus outer membrane usher protein [Luteibacter sp. 329MFSha]SEW15373.1 outer membrane usher protein [Luteibacter sp. 329MFSha]